MAEGRPIGFDARAVPPRFLRAALSALAAHAFVTLDDHGRVTGWNEAARRLSGWDEDEVLAATLDRFYPPQARAAGEPERILARARSSGALELEGWCLRKDGTRFWVVADVVPVHAGRGADGFAIVARDATARRRVARDQQWLGEATQALHGALELRAVAERLARAAVPRLGPFAIVDLLEDPTRRAGPVAHHADPARRAAAAEAAARLGLARRDGPVAHAVRAGEPLAVAGTAEEVAAALGRPDAAPALAALGVRALRVFPLRRERTLGVLAIAAEEVATPLARALADRASRAVENAIRHEAALRAVRVREDVLAVVSHDLRSPLNALRLGVRLQLRRAADEGRSEAERRSLANLDRAVDRMEGLVGDLLDMGRIRAGRLPLARGAEPVASLLAECLAEASPAGAERGVVVRLGEVPEHAAVDCDRRRVLQVLANLVGNGIKFAGAGGEVVIGAREEDGTIRFTVEDGGPGIRTEDVPHLFEPWWSSEGGGKLGTGLGLFIARGIVEAHGGAIGFARGAARGSVFWFTLPRAGTA